MRGEYEKLMAAAAKTKKEADAKMSEATQEYIRCLDARKVWSNLVDVGRR